MRLLVSLHDVTPRHTARLRLAEQLLADSGVTSAAYLLVPRFHGTHDIALDRSFRDWCGTKRPYAVEWLLHGLEHLEPAHPPRHRVSTGEWIRRQWLTAGEGEFLALGPADIDGRVREGIERYVRCLGCRPSGFVAPAWLFTPSLPDVLRTHGIRFTEDHRFIYDLRNGTDDIPAPVITWATRTVARRVGSTIVVPRLLAAWQHRPLLRLALHPHDFDHPATVRSIRALLRRALTMGECTSYAAVLTP